MGEVADGCDLGQWVQLLMLMQGELADGCDLGHGIQNRMDRLSAG